MYRHLFENKKYVEEYRIDDIEQGLGLDREKLINMALLLGSDYTEGISGIGIVNAMEIVHAFSGENGLEEFKHWVKSTDPEIVAAAHERVGTGDMDRRHQSASSSNDMANDDDNVREFQSKHNALRKNWEIKESFPDNAVIQAYKEPNVDKSKDKFTFGRPDVAMISQFCRERFGWETSKVDELLLPVLRSYDQRQTQLRIDSFLQYSQRFAKIKSKRLQKAVAGIRGKDNPDIVLGGEQLSHEPPKAGSQSKRKRSSKRKADDPKVKKRDGNQA